MWQHSLLFFLARVERVRVDAAVDSSASLSSLVNGRERLSFTLAAVKAVVVGEVLEVVPALLLRLLLLLLAEGLVFFAVGEALGVCAVGLLFLVEPRFFRGGAMVDGGGSDNAIAS